MAKCLIEKKQQQKTKKKKEQKKKIHKGRAGEPIKILQSHNSRVFSS
jgi:hypothetical protein